MFSSFYGMFTAQHQQIECEFLLLFTSWYVLHYIVQQVLWLCTVLHLLWLHVGKQVFMVIYCVAAVMALCCVASVMVASQNYARDLIQQIRPI